MGAYRFARSAGVTCELRKERTSTYQSPGPDHRPLCVDLFCGAGGLSLGFESAGFDIAAAVDIDPIHCATHEYNFPYSSTICQDVTKTNGKKIRNHADIASREIAVVIGGAPCQGFSLIGKRQLDDPRNALLLHFVRLVLELEPAYFAFENVNGLTIGEQRSVLEEMIEAFAPAYRVVRPYQILNAADFGVPQNRNRLFLLGARGDRPAPDYPAQHAKRVTVSEALDDLPDADRFDELRHRDWAFVVRETLSSYAARLHNPLLDPGHFGHPRPYATSTMTASLRTLHSPSSRDRFAATTPGETEPVSRFARLSLHAQANTLRAGTANDHGAFTSPRPIHPRFPRVITTREAARLHSYPDWFRPHVTKWHGFRQMGNSVPPLLARAVATEVLRALNHTPSPATTEVPLGDPTLLELSAREAVRLYGLSHDLLPRRKRAASTDATASLHSP